MGAFLKGGKFIGKIGFPYFLEFGLSGNVDFRRIAAANILMVPKVRIDRAI